MFPPQTFLSLSRPPLVCHRRRGRWGQIPGDDPLAGRKGFGPDQAGEGSLGAYRGVITLASAF
jgi:hypothetical protein